MVNTTSTAAGAAPDLQDIDEKLEAKVKKRTSDEASAQQPREEHRASKKRAPSSLKPSSRKKQKVANECKQEVKDLQRLTKEMHTRIATLAAKKTSQQRKRTITKVLGTGWEKAPTVTMELTKERLNNILTGMGTEDTPSKSESIP